MHDTSHPGKRDELPGSWTEMAFTIIVRDRQYLWIDARGTIRRTVPFLHEELWRTE
jgi:hypothetical protein